MRSLMGGLFRNATPVPYTSRRSGMFGGFGMRNDTEAHLGAMGSCGTLFAIVNATSEATSLVNWHLFRKAKSGNVEEREETTSHAALVVWNKPNDFFTRQELVETVQQHIELTGEGWTVIGRDPRARSLPLELWPVRPDRMRPLQHHKDFIIGWEYSSPDGEKVPLELDEVKMLRQPNPLDPYRGMGAVQTILTDLDSSRYSAEWNRNFFLNSAEPGGIIEVDRRLDDDEFDEMVTRWRDQHQGVAQAHRVAVIEQGKWVDRKFSMRDMQFAELRGVSSEIIRQAFRFPKPLLGTVDDVNRAVAEAMGTIFAQWLLVPRLERWKGFLNNDFLPLFGRSAEGYEFDYDSPVPADREADDRERTSRATFVSTLVGARFDPEEVLAVAGLPPIKHLGPAPAPVLPPAPAEDEEEPAEDAVDAAAQARASLVASVRYHAWHTRAGESATCTACAREALGAFNAATAGLGRVQQDWEDALDKLLTEWEAISEVQREELAQQIRDAVDSDDLEQLANLSVDSTTAGGVLAAALIALALLGGDSVVDEAAGQGVTIALGLASGHELRDVATTVAGLLAASLSTAAGLEAMRHRGDGASGTQVAETVREYLGGMSDRYLRDNLGGALTGAQAAGRVATMQTANPQPTTFVASEELDPNVCKPCRDVDGTVFTTLSAALAEYPLGWHRSCLGRERCRGQVLPFWETDPS